MRTENEVVEETQLILSENADKLFLATSIIKYNADLSLTFASAQASSKSDIISARPFAALIHQLVRFQLTRISLLLLAAPLTHGDIQNL